MKRFVISVLLIISFIRFEFQYRLDVKFVSFMELKCKLTDDIGTHLALCSAYTNIQYYRTALEKYDKILNTPNLKNQLTSKYLEQINTNKKFCDAPLFWSSGAKDHKAFRYFHYFFLKRIGRARYSFICENDILEFNSFLRTYNG